MNFDSLVDGLPNALAIGVVVGIATSAVWTAFVWLHNCRRNRLIERSFRKSLKPNKMCFHADGSFGIEVVNDTLMPVVIRSVEVRGGENSKFVAKLSMHEESSPRGTTCDPRGWVELPGKTHANWHLTIRSHQVAFLKQFVPVKTIVVIVEYKTIVGSTRIIEIEPAPNSDWMQRSFEDLFNGSHPHFDMAMEQREQFRSASQNVSNAQPPNTH